MKHFIKKLFLSSAAAMCITCLPTTNIIEGDVFLMPSGVHRADEETINQFKSLDITIQEGDIMIPVWATSRDVPGQRRPIIGLMIASNEGVPAVNREIEDTWLRLRDEESMVSKAHNIFLATSLNQERRALEDKHNLLHDEELENYCRFEPDGSDNWSAHGHPLLEKIRFPRHLPYIFFKGKQDGDTITFQLKDKQIALRINQEAYRYSKIARRNHGFGGGWHGFEEILNRLVANS